MTAETLPESTKSTDASVPCGCIEQMNDLMGDKNTRIVVTLGIPRDGSPMFVRPMIATEKVESRKRGSAALAIPTFCPFCGERYERAPAVPA
jgi:hypothetical protein